VVGGMLTSLLGWRAIFFINIPVGIAALAGLARTSRSHPRPAPFDLAGQLCSVLALAGLTFAIIEGGRNGFTDPQVLIALVAFAAATAAFLYVETSAPHPAVPLDQFRSPTVAACTATGFALNFAYFGVVFVLSLFYQRERGDSALVAGLMFVPMTLLIMAANILAGRLTNLFGSRPPMVVGQVVEAAGFLTVLLVGPHAPAVWQLVALVPIGLGAGTASPPMMTALLEAVPPERAGAASGFLNAARQVGSALGVAIFGALVADPDRFETGMRLSLLLAAASLAATAITTFALVRPPAERARASHATRPQPQETAVLPTPDR
jgi:MFS transporter, DHA2 family, methylenomycin A resistance protein